MLTPEEAAAPNPEHEALRDAAGCVATIIELTAKVSEKSGKDVNEAIEAAFWEQINWILRQSASAGRSLT
jgi:hypothetical protein